MNSVANLVPCRTNPYAELIQKVRASPICEGHYKSFNVPILQIGTPSPQEGKRIGQGPPGRSRPSQERNPRSLSVSPYLLLLHTFWVSYYHFVTNAPKTWCPKTTIIFSSVLLCSGCYSSTSQPEWLNQQEIISHGPRGQKFKIKIWQGGFLQSPLLGLQAATFSPWRPFSRTSASLVSLPVRLG